MNEFPLATAASGPFSIALGPDGNVWFTEVNSNKIGRVTPSGVVTEFTTAAGSRPGGIVAGRMERSGSLRSAATRSAA
jgi:virginiamycin B lyase